MNEMSESSRAGRLRRPLIVLGVVILVVAWIASGMLMRDPLGPPGTKGVGPMHVAVALSRAEPVERLLVLQGRVEPDQRVVVRAETAGQVDQWAVERGAVVAENDLLARLRMDDRGARLAQVVARVRGAESEYEATRRLFDEGHASRTALEARTAELEAARAEREAVELDIRNTRIVAPVAGVMNQRLAERGEFVGRGDPVAEIIDNDPLLAVVWVPQHQIGRVRTGQEAHVRFLDGRRAEGRVRFVSAVAEAGTQTFRTEIEVPNPDEGFPSGISAGVEIVTEVVPAHRLSPAVISLDDTGRVGVKAVEEDDRVAFHPVEVIRTERDGLWVTGLPPSLRVITVGQGFVTAGEKVVPRIEDPGADAARSASPTGAGDIG